MTKKTLSKHLLLLREKKNKMQKEVAKELGLTATAYNHYEKGNREPDLETLKKLASYFEVSIDYLLGYEDKKTRYDLNRKAVLNIINEKDEKIEVNFLNFEDLDNSDFERIKEDIELVIDLYKKKKEGK